MRAESGSTSVQRSVVPGVQKIAAAESLRHEPRQVAAVIEVRVRQHDGVDRARRRPAAPPSSAARSSFSPWNSPQSTRTRCPSDLEQVLRSGDRAGGAEKRAASPWPMTILGTRMGDPMARCARAGSALCDRRSLLLASRRPRRARSSGCSRSTTSTIRSRKVATSSGHPPTGLAWIDATRTSRGRARRRARRRSWTG